MDPLNIAANPQLREAAKSYWATIDVDALQPILHGPEYTAAQQAAARAQMAEIERINAENNIKDETRVLFPDLARVREHGARESHE